MSNALIPASRNDWQVSIEGRRKGPKDNGYIKLAIGTTIGLTVGFLIYTAYKNGIKASK